MVLYGAIKLSLVSNPVTVGRFPVCSRSGMGTSLDKTHGDICPHRIKPRLPSDKS